MDVREEPYSVSSYIEVINAKLGEVSAQIRGEVSEVKRAGSGHVYPVLKDNETGHILPCTIWKYDYALSGVDLEVGMEVLVTGKASFYGPFGKLSFNAKSVELVGEGALKKAYEKLKAKLSAEGLFAIERKRAIPRFPRRIGVITSVHGEVIHDFSSNLRKSGFIVRILNSKVEGPESGRDLTLAVRAMRNVDIEVLVLMRGGGSMQSLAGFDNEALVREIATFPVPVLAGVGHHQDVPLAALVADVAESTPSFVAAHLNRPWEQARTSLERSEQSIMTGFEELLVDTQTAMAAPFTTIIQALRSIFEDYDQVVGRIYTGIQKIDFEIERSMDALSQSWYGVSRGFSRMLLNVREAVIRKTPRLITELYTAWLTRAEDQMHHVTRLIETNNPERQLRLGYSIVSSGDSIVKSIHDITLGQELLIQVSDGSIRTEVNAVE